MKIRRHKRKLAPVMRVSGEVNEDGRVPVVSAKGLRRLKREYRRRLFIADQTREQREAVVNAARAKRQRRRARNLGAS